MLENRRDCVPGADRLEGRVLAKVRGRVELRAYFV